jgi:hypothetical protein
MSTGDVTCLRTGPMTGLGTVGGTNHGQLQPARWTARACPPYDIGVTQELGIGDPSRVDGRNGPTLQQRVVVPNPQHLLLTLIIETSLHEEKCPL